MLTTFLAMFDVAQIFFKYYTLYAYEIMGFEHQGAPQDQKYSVDSMHREGVAYTQCNWRGKFRETQNPNENT